MRRAAPALVLTALLTVAGCSSGGEPAARNDTAPLAEATSPGQPSPDDGIPDETVPLEELTPPEGAFREREREYLTDRVPEGADPAAILQLGSEACDRIGYLERHDTEGAVNALRTGEIPDAEAAIEHLCPEYAELLAEAERSERSER
jgi:hypothetical protein